MQRKGPTRDMTADGIGDYEQQCGKFKVKTENIYKKEPESGNGVYYVMRRCPECKSGG